MYQFRPPFAFLNLSKLVKLVKLIQTCRTHPVLTVRPQHTETSGTSTIFMTFSANSFGGFFNGIFIHFLLKVLQKFHLIFS